MAFDFNKKPYDSNSKINAFGFSYSMQDFENWEKNRVYNISKEIQYKAIINTINTSLPQFIIYYYFKDLGFDCEYELKKNIPENILNRMESPRNYTLDLYNPEKKLVIEYDGKEFHKDISKDIERDRKILTGPIFDDPIAKYIVRIREGYLLYKGQNSGVKEYKISQYNQGFNKEYQDTLQKIYSEFTNRFGKFSKQLDFNNIDVIRDEATIRCAYFEYAEKLIEEKGENIFDYYPYKDILKIYANANKPVPNEVKDKHLAFAIRTAYNYNTKYVIEAINKEYQVGDAFYKLLQRLETKYPTLKRAELCDSNRIVVQDAINLILFSKYFENETLINDLIKGNIDNKAEKTLVLSDTKTQLDFAKNYDGVDKEYYNEKKFKLMNYRKNEKGEICPEPNVLLLHKIKYEEEEWGLWHEIQSISKEFNVSPLRALFKKININEIEKEGIKENDFPNNEKDKNKATPDKYFDHFLGIPQVDKFNETGKQFEETKDILGYLYKNKDDISNFLRLRSDFYKDVLLDKTDTEIFKLVQKSFLTEKQDDKYKIKEDLKNNLNFASSLGVNSLNTLFLSAKTSDELNKILNSYGVNASSFKTALAHDYVMKKDYDFETTQFASIIQKNPALFPDMKDLSLKEIYKETIPIVMERKWNDLVHPFFINTQKEYIHKKMDNLNGFKKMKETKEIQKAQKTHQNTRSYSETYKKLSKTVNNSKNMENSKDLKYSDKSEKSEKSKDSNISNSLNVSNDSRRPRVPRYKYGKDYKNNESVEKTKASSSNPIEIDIDSR